MYEFITLIKTRMTHCYEMFLLKDQKVAGGDADVAAIHEYDTSLKNYTIGTLTWISQHCH
jgi:hypothetical protein